MSGLPSRLPVMQAPIGGCASVALVIAVCRAGGLGTLAASWTAPADLRAEIAAIRQATDAPFAVNLVLDFSQDERVELCAELAVPVVSLSWGVRADHVARLRSAGCDVLVQVGDVAAGRAAGAAGASALIAQGHEAGGHVQSEIGLGVLVAALARAVSVPIVAAGGIADGATARAAIAAGASAVALGTRFVASVESGADPGWKRALVAAEATDTAFTSLFDVGWPNAAHRVLRNSTYRAWVAAGSPPSGQRPGEGETIAHDGELAIVRYSDVPPRVGMTGDLEALCLYAGQGVSLIDEVLPAAEIVEGLASAVSASRYPAGSRP